MSRSSMCIFGALSGVLLLTAITVSAQSFTEIPMPGSPMGDGSVMWGDHDGDGDMDALVSGMSASGPRTVIYRNDAGVYALHDPGLHQVSNGTAFWGKSNWSDMFWIWVNGIGESGPLESMYANYNGAYQPVFNIGIPGCDTAAALGDFDNDGREDFILCSAFSNGTNVSTSTFLLRNSGDDWFVNNNDERYLPNLYGGGLSWGDFDGDDDLDLLFAGTDVDTLHHALVFAGDDGIFTDIEAGLTGLRDASVDCGDYDADGDLDILLTGAQGDGTRRAIVYVNDAGAFTDAAAGLPGVSSGSCGRWGDVDNDGDLDILLAGETDTGEICRIYRNDGATFTDIGAGLPGVSLADAAWCDHDDDGDLDILLQGYSSATGAYITSIYRNDGATPNTPPTAPTNLQATLTPAGVVLSWDAASDAQTPAAGLSYGLRIGTYPGGDDVARADADVTGWRRIARRGHVLGTSWPASVDHGTYYWSVQAVDGALAGSAYAAEGTFTTTWGIDLIEDIPFDHGGQLNLTFTRCFNDRFGNDAEVESYTILRRVEPERDDEIWDHIATIPARGDAYYSLVVPTLRDSCETGWYPAMFKVKANMYHYGSFECDPIPGYSTVDLLPGPPAKAAHTSALQLELCEPDRSVPPTRADTVEPLILSVTDIPYDQGGQVRVTWSRSSLDPWSPQDRVVTYHLFRGYYTGGTGALLWQYIGEVPARGDELYAAVVPSLYDWTFENPFGALYYVSAVTTVRTRHFDSETLMGFSSDDLAPAPPTYLVADYLTGAGNRLSWSASTDDDYRYTNIYCGDTPGFTPSPATLCGQTAELVWQDPAHDGPAWYYRVSHVDFDDNESETVAVENLSGLTEGPSPAPFALHPCRPNPFNPSTEIRFSLPSAGIADLRVYDLAGRLVRILAAGETLEAGEHARIWNGRDDADRKVAAGAYVYRLECGSDVQTRTMTLVK